MRAAGPLSKAVDTDVDNTDQTLKSSGGTLFVVSVYNPSNAAAYLQLFDASSATVGTTVPDFVLGLATTATEYFYFGPTGVGFSTAIHYAAATTATGNGDPSTGLVVSFGYE